MSNIQIASKNQVKTSVRDLIQSTKVKEQIALVLPKHMTADRMARVACTAILKTPKLADCTPESLLQALMLCSQAGLEPDGRNAHLIPYGTTVQVIFDWKGIVALARRNGVQNIAADVVCENDVLQWERNGDGLQFKHVVDWRKPRGAMFAAFCIWKYGEQFDGEIMTKEEIDAIRKRSKSSGSGPWVTDYSEMAKKTVVRRASKKWPLDAELAEAVQTDEPTVEAPVNRPIFGKPEPESPVIGQLADAPQAEDDVPMVETPPPVEEKPKTEKTAINYVKGLRGLMKLGQISDAQLLEYAHAALGWDDSLGTLEDAMEVTPSKVKELYENWSAALTEINRLKAAIS